MLFPQHLLEQAKHLARRERKRPRQASLRRAVSTAYYALFHLLVHEATLNWKRAEQRALFARFFEHGKMKGASERQWRDCNRYLNSKPTPSPGPALDFIVKLGRVANAFVEAQQLRHAADYDNSITWRRTEVIELITLVDDAFQSWHAIRAAQAFLISLLGNSRGA